ncbi:hypothetical protein JCM8547_005159 [Rhodosporidiobolus lusitaniae]
MASSPAVKSTTKTVIEWKINKVKLAVAVAKAGEDKAMRPGYGEMPEGWEMEFTLRGRNAEDKHGGVYVFVRGTRAEELVRSAKKTWERNGEYSLTIEMVSVDGYGLIRPVHLKDRKFDSDSGWGSNKIISWIDLGQPDVTDAEDSARLRDKLMQMAGFYDNAKYSDVVFCIEGDGESNPSYLLGLEAILDRTYHFQILFHGGYGESQRKVKRNLVKPIAEEPKSIYGGDGYDFAAFENLHPAKKRAPKLMDRRPKSHARGGRYGREGTRSISPPSQCPVVDSGSESSEGEEQIRVDEKKDMAGDAGSPRNDVGSVEKNGNEDEEPAKEGRADADEREPAKKKRQVDETDDTTTVTEVKIADCSLTVQNVDYEAFCRLRADFTAYREPVLKFLLENWDKVKSTPAMKQVLSLLEQRELNGGGEILGEIFEGLSKSEKKDDKGEADKDS